ncbi:outer membrane beta-barrel protein [Bacteroides gallinaceum]|uniref:outer membrane beta-barrel protein n=1 Tax=Bacteroides gallinaceum TaxID=1462571 RepID=UPI0025A437CC|nr:outer membrane beta-barrel protein [Bacteroides gallinaceum]MDM8154295.1 outer membrane beta-barrel protein [Bacteroides gallinaceum]
MKAAHLIILIGTLWALGLAKGYAQHQVVTGRLVLSDKQGAEEALPYANVAVLGLPDSALVKGTSSDKNGQFSLAFLRKPETEYALKASFTGCMPLAVALDSEADTIRLGTLRMRDDALRLSEVVVTAPLKAVEQKGDTTVYNVAAYPTPEGSYLEALVRRIPGLSYDPKTHEMKFNGYPIQEITVNGKDFFKGNKDVVLENLPVKFISQLKVYDKPTEQEEKTGMKSNEKNYVLDLKTKREFNGSLLTYAEAGYGTYKRRDLNGRMMRFKESGDNFMVNARSTNRNFTSADEDNILNSVNLSASKKVKEGLDVSGNVNYSYNRNGSQSGTYNEQYLSNGNQYALAESDQWGKNRNVNGHLNVNWEINKRTSLIFSASGRYSHSRSQSESRTATFNARPEADTKNPFAHIGDVDKATWINDNRQQSLSQDNNMDYDLRLEVVQKIGEKDDFLSFDLNHGYRKGTQHGYTLSSIDYYQLQNAAGGDSLYYQNQYRRTPQSSMNDEAHIAYTHAFNKKNRLQLSYGLEREYEKLDGATYDLSPFEADQPALGVLPEGYGEGEIDSLRTRSHSRTLRHNVSLNYNYTSETWGIVASVGMSPQRRSIEQATGEHRADTVARSIEWRSQLSLSYQQEGSYFVLSYNGNTSQPGLEDMVSPTDYSSPLYIRRSNPHLRPSYRHSVYAVFSNFQEGISTSLSWNQTFNSVTRATLYNKETGGRETMPVNINGNWNLMGNGSYDKRVKQFHFMLRASGGYNRDVSLINEDASQNVNRRSVTGATSLSSNIRLAYLPAWGNIDLTGEWSFYQSKNSLQGRNTYTRNYTCGVESSVNLPLHFIVSTDAGYTFRSGTGMNGADNNELLWNLKVSWKFLKEKRGELSVYWADILSQRKSFMRYASATAFSERYEEQLRGYVLFSFAYRFERMK